MGWCLDCHRNPEPNLRPRDKVTDMAWRPEGESRGARREISTAQYQVKSRTYCTRVSPIGAERAPNGLRRTARACAEHGAGTSLLAGNLRGAERGRSCRAEFPVGVDEPPDAVSRRTFMKLVGASMALAGVGALRRAAAEKILPYVATPADEVTPGLPQSFATSLVARRPRPGARR